MHCNKLHLFYFFSFFMYLHGLFAGPIITSVSPNFGPTAGGTSVTITGSGFTGVTAVNFGSTAASIGSSTDTSITVTAPYGVIGTVNVKVVTPGGTSPTSTADLSRKLGGLCH